MAYVLMPKKRSDGEEEEKAAKRSASRRRLRGQGGMVASPLSVDGVGIRRDVPGVRVVGPGGDG